MRGAGYLVLGKILGACIPLTHRNSVFGHSAGDAKPSTSFTTYPVDVASALERRMMSAILILIKSHIKTHQSVWLRLAWDPLVRKARA